MKLIKRIFLVLLILIVVGAIYLATLDGKFNVERSRVIPAQPEVVFDELNDFRNWKEWGPWYEMDSTIVATYPKNTVGVGASYSWTDMKGGGAMKTIAIEKPNKIDQEVTFNTPMGDMKSNIVWRMEKVAKGTKVTWGMKGELGFFYRMAASSMEEEIGPMEERGLELLDSVIQNKMKVFSVKSHGIIEYSGGYYLYNTTSSKIQDMNAKFQPMMHKIQNYVTANNIRVSGSPFTIYHKFDQNNGTTMFSVCFPITEKLITNNSDILVNYLNNGAYLKTILTGSYDHSKTAWENAYQEIEGMVDYVADDNGEPFEIYVNNPENTPNPANLITEIYIPVKKVEVLN